MIEGVKLNISSDELKKKILERVEYHRQKFEFYSKKVEELEPVKGEMESSSNAFTDLKNKADNHQARMEFFQFLADHIIPKEIYRLQTQDLTNLEFISRYF